MKTKKSFPFINFTDWKLEFTKWWLFKQHLKKEWDTPYSPVTTALLQWCSFQVIFGQV